jgi:flavorubredoxin
LYRTAISHWSVCVVSRTSRYLHRGTMSKALVIYDTKFGNTEKVANALVQGLAAQGIIAESVNVDRVAIDRLSEYDALLIGGPTHRQKMSEPMAMFLDKLNKSLVKGKAGFSFDTKVEHRFAGSAGKRIERTLKKLGMKVVRPHASAIVVGREGPLKEGTEDMFRQIGEQIAREITSLTS